MQNEKKDLIIAEVEVLGTSLGNSWQGSKKNSSFYLELSKTTLYLLLHTIFIGSILLYQSIWLFSKSTNAYCYAFNAENLVPRGQEPGILVYHYKAGEKMFRETTTRNGYPINKHDITVRYLPFAPSISRPDTFAENWLGFLITWTIFFVITSMIFFIPNDTMPKNSFFYFSRQRPWIHMIIK